MTIVIGIYANHTPLVVADSLVSQENVSANGITTPILSEIDTRTGLKHTPVGLARKFWLFPDGSIFFYSGIIGDARRFFDYLNRNLNKEDRYDENFHAEAIEHLKRNSRTFSFLVMAPNKEDVKIFIYNANTKYLERFGTVLFLGSGRNEAETIMEKYHFADPINEDARLLNAYNLAARLTLDYRDRGLQGSKMAASSCGGYFEVIEPMLYAIKSSVLYRCTAHIFLRLASEISRLTKFLYQIS